MQTFLDTLFGEGVQLVDITVYFILGIFGIFSSLVIDVYSSGIQISQFDRKRWLKDNGFRVIVSIMVLFAAMVFGEEIVGIPTSNWSMFLAGFTSDKIIENLLQRKRKQKTK